MESFLHNYFGWSYATYFAIALVLVWIVIVGLLGRLKKARDKKYSLHKKWWFWVGTILLILHWNWITYINPSYFGYGTPDSFNLIEVRGNNIILYDYKYAYIEDEDGNHEENIPNLRVHVIDRITHDRTYWGLIGDYYYPVIYGPKVILLENDTYSDNSDYTEIESIRTFNASSNEVITLAKNDGQIKVGENKYPVFDIISSALMYRVQCENGDEYLLDNQSLEFEFYDPDSISIPEKSNFQLYPSSNSQDKRVLHINNVETEELFLFGDIVNEHLLEEEPYILVHYQKDMSKSKPTIALLNSMGYKLWELTLEDLREHADDDDLKYIHRTLLVDDVCYVTSNEHIFEFDLITGKLNWMLSL